MRWPNPIGYEEAIMADFDFGEGLRKVFLAGVGALATGVEKSQEIVDDLVKKGEITVEQGKQLNTELKRKAQQAKSGAQATKDDDKPEA
jgi:polyhydroxyalkanoate synthesis regulator phasin